MLKKTIKHKDLDGNQVESDAYFNLTKAEAIELNIRNDLEVIGRSRNNNEIMDTFKRILQMSYGVRTGNGQFIKEGFAAFAASEAYSELFMEIWSNPEYALEFVRAILPTDVVDAMNNETTESKSDIPTTLADHPSMQGHKSSDKTRYQPSEVPGKADLVDSEYQEFLDFRAAKQAAQTPPERVSSPEVPQNDSSLPPRDELV